MLKSLRTRIFVSHLAVIGLVFLLTFIVAFVPIRRAQSLLEVRRLQDLTRPVVVQVSLVLQRPALGNAVLPDLLDAQARQLDARIVLLGSSGQVFYDTRASDELSSETSDRIKTTLAKLPSQPRPSNPISRVTAQPPTRYGGVVNGERIVVAGVPQIGDRYVALISSVERFPLARELLLPLLLAACVGLLGAVVATAFLSRSIARPITRLTAAADAVAAGDLDHRVPDGGGDEVGRLVQRFNSMVAQLGSTYESQRRLLTNIAHELRTPLTSIQGYAQGLNDGVFTDEMERRDALKAITDESERVNELVVQILQLARLESGQAAPVFRPLDVNRLIDRVVQRHRPLAMAAGVALYGSPGQAPAVEADEALLEQAIDNLLRNAIRHTPPGGSVRVSAAPAADTDAERPRLRIRVSDSGPGIASQDIPHIFDRFYRVERAGDAPPDRIAGFGLGLAIVREIVTSHRGQVGVESQPGAGTTFIVDLPMPDTQPESSLTPHQQHFSEQRHAEINERDAPI